MVTVFNPLTILSKSKKLKKSLGECRPRLYRLAYSWSHDPALADELTQEALAKGLKNIAQIRNPETVERWLFGILANCWRDHFRRTRPTENIDDYVQQDDNTPERQLEHQRLTDCIRTAVAQLPSAQRQVVTLVDLEGFRYAEVSEILQTPIGTVMSRLCRARKALADNLFEYRNQETGENNRIRRIS